MPPHPMRIDSVSVHTVVTMTTMGSLRHADWGQAENFLIEKGGASGAGRHAPTMGSQANACL